MAFTREKRVAPVLPTNPIPDAPAEEAVEVVYVEVEPEVTEDDA